MQQAQDTSPEGRYRKPTTATKVQVCFVFFFFTGVIVNPGGFLLLKSKRYLLNVIGKNHRGSILFWHPSGFFFFNLLEYVQDSEPNNELPKFVLVLL